MRKFIKIIFLIITFVFIGRNYLPINLTENAEIYLFVFYLFIAIPYAIYELKEIRKDDKINKTNLFKKRIQLVIIVAILYTLYAILLNYIYKID